MSSFCSERTAKLQVEVRCASGSCCHFVALEFELSDAAKVKICDLKEILCSPPHNLCTHAARLALVTEGRVLDNDTALLNVPFPAPLCIITAVNITPSQCRLAGATSATHPNPGGQLSAEASEAAAEGILPNFFDEESSLFGKDKVLAEIRTKR